MRGMRERRGRVRREKHMPSERAQERLPQNPRTKDRYVGRGSRPLFRSHPLPISVSQTLVLI